MRFQDRFRQARAEWMLLTFYERFEQVVILILTGLISPVVVFAVWNLALKIFHAVLAPQGFDPTDYSVFQAISRLVNTRSNSTSNTTVWAPEPLLSTT